MMLTYQTRLQIDDRTNAALEEYASACATVERSLFRAVATGKTTASCKSNFLKQHGITARQFNSCRVSLEGKMAACRESQMQGLAHLKQQIAALDKKLDQLQKKPSKKFSLHQINRRRQKLSHRLFQLEIDFKEKRIRLCFGGKKLFRAQFHLEHNGFDSHQEWKKAWEARRNSEFFLLGSKDESGGNQTCTACVMDDGSFTLRLRLPVALEPKYGKYIEMKQVRFAYGHEAILASLHDPQGQAISYRLKQNCKGWTLFASTSLAKVDPVCLEGTGCIGIDLNADHIACVETNRFGNPNKQKSLSMGFLWQKQRSTQSDNRRSFQTNCRLGQTN